MPRIVTCDYCATSFDRGYAICSARAAKPQFCRPACRRAYMSAKAAERLSQRFWSKVEIQGADECWPWQEYRDPKGYGRFQMANGDPWLAHRAAVFLATGEDPGELKVCHHCDNPPCCNPSHLFLGTVKDNVQDMIAKGRRGVKALKGAANPCSILTPDQVSIIYLSDKSNKELALQYSVTSSAIYNIRHGKTWSHLTGHGRAA